MTAGTIRVAVLEHPSELDDDTLASLMDWNGDELARMAWFADRGARTSWCLGRRLLWDASRGTSGPYDTARRLELSSFGKPSFPVGNLRFNLSHAPGCVALAVAQDLEVGIAVEAVDEPNRDYLAIAAEQFRDDERAWIGAAVGFDAWRRFLSLFVQKEAWLKALGTGLGRALRDAPADQALPPAHSPGRLLRETGGPRRYFLAAACTGPGAEEARFDIESRTLGASSD